MFDIEKCHKCVFEMVAVSEIMNKLKIEENEAIKILNKMYKRIEMFSKECLNSKKGYYSIRYAIMNRINRIKLIEGE